MVLELVQVADLPLDDDEVAPALDAELEDPALAGWSNGGAPSACSLLARARDAPRIIEASPPPATTIILTADSGLCPGPRTTPVSGFNLSVSDARRPKPSDRATSDRFKKSKIYASNLTPAGCSSGGRSRRQHLVVPALDSSRPSGRSPSG